MVLTGLFFCSKIRLRMKEDIAPDGVGVGGCSVVVVIVHSEAQDNELSDNDEDRCLLGWFLWG